MTVFQNWKTHLRHSWWKYLAVLAGAIVLWNGIFTALAQPEENEKLTLACFVETVDLEALERVLEKDRALFTKQPLKTVSVDAYLDYASSSMYFSYALAAADVFLFREDMVTPDDSGNVPVTYKALCQPIPMDAFLAEMGDAGEHLRLFGDESGVYGVYLSGQGQKNRFTQACGENTGCILFLNPGSVNLKGLYGKGNAADGAALDLLRYLLEQAED